ncbi:MAG: ATP-binding protein [candidate division Zixibacteria bacterium]|nr:ATP-binding protein [candidate division Zixibacteria bacterium]
MKKSKAIRKGNQIIIPSSLDYLCCVDEFMEKKLKKLGVDKNLLADCAISLSEVVSNAIHHGNLDNPEKKVKIELFPKPDQITFRVTDQGNGFDPQCLKNPIDPECLLKEIGRGLFIVKNLMDELNFRFEPGCGTTVEIIKKLK